MNITQGSWKTTSAGLMAIVGGIVGLWFKRHALDEATVMGGLTAIVTGLGLLVARDNDKTSEDVKAKPLPPGGTAPKAGQSKIGLVFLLVIPAVMLAGCASAPKAVVTVTSVVDAAMEEWARAYVTGRTTPKLDAQVRAAHELYREEARRALVIYQAAVDSSNAASRLEALTIAKTAADMLLDELFPVLPGVANNSKLMLKEAVAP
jgi:hypothetical protein